MATAEEIFAAANAAGLTDEGHIVVGFDRYITVPPALKRLAVQFDHNVETVTFDCPRYWDEHDMSQMHVYINYLRADKQPGVYRADNVRVDEYDDTIMHFEWTIYRNVTEVKGTIVFLVCVKKADSEGYEQNHWNSELCDDCYISEGLESEVGEIIDELVPDVIERWYNEFAAKAESTTAELTSKVDNKITELDKAFDTKSAELTTTVDNALTDLTTKVDTKITELDEAFDAKSAELNTKIDDKIAEIDNKSAQLTQTVDTKIAEVTGTVNTTTANLTSKVDDKIAELEESANKTTADLTQTVNEAIENLTNTVNESTAKATETVETLCDDMLAAKEAGEFNGATFTPNVSEDGDLSWTNDKGLENPATVNIKGDPGKDAISPTLAVTNIEGGHRITITDADGTKTIDVKNGIDGKTDTAAVLDFMKKYVVIGDTEPENGPVLWFDTSARKLLETIILLELGEVGEDAPVMTTIDALDYPVTNASEAKETSVKNTYEIQIT